MYTFKIILTFCFSIFFTNTFFATLEESIKNIVSNTPVIMCIDGGGSKTEMQILDAQGNVIFSKKSGGSNINVVGKDGVKNVINDLLNDIKIEKTNCVVIGGFSGAGLPETKNFIKDIFKEHNFNENKIIITSDADMTLETIADDGIILISGTGSICFAKKNTEILRVGGLGWKLGDEGSGYSIGIAAIKAALEDEYGWGEPTTLKALLKTHFNMPDLKNIRVPLYSDKNDKLDNEQIAAIAPLVFSQAERGDALSIAIVDDAAQQLGKMLATMVKIGNFTNCPIYLFGGTFKNKNADQFIQKMLQAAHLEKWKISNKSQDNATVLAVQRLQRLAWLTRQQLK